MKSIIAASVVALMTSTAVSAQAPDEPAAHATEIALGGGLFGGAGLGRADANLRANAAVLRDYGLFETTTRLASMPMVEARIGIGLSRRVQLEWHTMFGRPMLRTSVQADVENAPALTVAERIDEFVIEGSVLINVHELRLGRRTAPFVIAGAGYLRQLHEGRTLIEQGHVYHAGGGVRHWLFVHDRGLIRAAGLRADARLYLLAGGVAFRDRQRLHGAMSGSFIVAF